MNNGKNQSPSFPETIRNAIDSRLVDVHTMLPGKVKAYYPSKGTVDVTLTVKQPRRQPDGTTKAVELPTLFNVPLAFPRCALAWDTWPVAEDDAVLVHFAERELGDWVQGQYGQVIDPGEGPMHSLNGPVAYLGGHPATHPITPTPSIRNRVLHAENELHLGGQDPSDFVALASLVLDELQKIKTKFDSHTHLVVVGSTPFSGPSAAPTSPMLTPQSVASEKVKCV